MTEIRSVPASQFPAVYPLIAPFFASLVERAHGGILPGYMESEVLAGRAHVLVAVVGEEIKAMALTTLAPNGDVTIPYCAGVDSEEWVSALLDFVEAEADRRGVRVEFIARFGWVRKANLAARGYRETHRVMERRANG